MPLWRVVTCVCCGKKDAVPLADRRGASQGRPEMDRPVNVLSALLAGFKHIEGRGSLVGGESERYRRPFTPALAAIVCIRVTNMVCVACGVFFFFFFL